MSFELEIFPTVKNKLTIKDVLDILNSIRESDRLGNLLKINIEQVNESFDINGDKEIMVDEDYKITLHDNLILFFSVIENDDIFDEFDILKGYNEHRISDNSLYETSLHWKDVGFSFNLELKSKKSEADFKLFMRFSIRLSEKFSGLICIKERMKSLDPGLYEPSFLIF